MKLILIVVYALLIVSLSSIHAQQNEESNEANEEIHGEGIKVTASFYPFYEIAKEIGGNKTIVTSVIPLGAEPHDWEISPQQIPQITEADMIIYNGIGFDSWLGEKDQFSNSMLVDVSKDLDLIKLENNEQEESKDSHEEDSHNDHAYGYDPHIWLDPIMVQNISKTISNALIKLDPSNTDYYLQNSENFIQKLNTLDASIKESISNCELKDFIAFHQAFRYFADRYGLTQHNVHESISPESEILLQQISKIIQLAKDLNIDTIYSEDLLNPRLAEILASEIPNGKVLLLSPIEGLNQKEKEKNIGYIDKMSMNIENLREGLKCK